MNRLKNLFDDMTTTEVTHSLVDELTTVRVTFIFLFFFIIINVYIYIYSQLVRSITIARIQLENRFRFLQELDTFINWLEETKNLNREVIQKKKKTFQIYLF